MPDQPTDTTTPAEPAAPPGGAGNGRAPALPENPEQRRRLIHQLRRNWREEMQSARLYRTLALGQPEGPHRALLLEMSGHELRHAYHWRRRLEELGGEAPAVRSGPRELILPVLARAFGLPSVLSLIEGGESRGKLDYIRQAQFLPDKASRDIAGSIIPDERRHQGAAARMRGDTAGEERSQRGGHVGDFVRDLIFGLNDGVVSNFSLISGVAGADTSHSVVLLAGVAGLIAGGVSMAAGAYLSNKSQAEVVAEEVRREAEEIDYAPEEERDELRRIYRLKGFSEEEVEILVRRITADRQRWLETLVTEELGLSIKGGPPPLLDAMFAGGGFAIGALVPLLPYLFASGTGALVAAAVLSVVGLFLMGASKTLVTSRSVVRSGMEMVVVGVAAAAVTNAVGRLIGGGHAA
ncbi:MAG TPA: VIT1/CCC1 transporter family protein [Candidatus Angelobacter sp.]|jgi:VIT1/CCC1 family predicted Fe2+/Mn2+ transporter/rubrerythrin|nr:VIT1/CCC1 transporter family protein [Candidatus Angelobacter sp.]